MTAFEFRQSAVLLKSTGRKAAALPRPCAATGISVSIGENLESDYYLKSRGEVKEFLRAFL